MTKAVEEKERVVVRFAGDSGDGIQLAGDRFAAATALIGNDLATLPDFPAEIRAPAGTLAGVSAFQIHFASREILTPGGRPNVLVVMNPAALRVNLAELERGGIVIANEDGFSDHNLRKAGYEDNPLDDETLADYRLFRVPMTSMTVRATDGIDGITARDAARSKNLFALGLVSWMYSRPTDQTLAWIEEKFAAKPAVQAANLAAFRAGYNFGETAELLQVHYEVKPAPAEPGTYRAVNGTQALALGLIAAGIRSGLPLFLASYPITPASEILHELSRRKRFGIRTVQAEDEIAAANMALGAAFGGHLGVTATSGPGMDLKAETIGLAVMLELPLLVVDVQRAGPSTGMPTKTEAADLLMAMHGRHGESPLPIVAAATPAGCFDAALEAARIAVTYRTPVILLSDTFLANSSEPWLLPDAAQLPGIDPGFATAPTGDGDFRPYARDRNLARPWALPGTRGLEHVIGGLEKQDGTGTISYDADNHARMTELRAAKVGGIAADIGPLEVDDPDGAEMLVLGWGSTYGAITGAVRRLRRRGKRVAAAHLLHLSPLPQNTAEVLRAYRRILIPEVNTGQLVKVIRAEFLIDAESYTKVEGLPIFAEELDAAIEERLSGGTS
ncbi:MAG: 2-oxoacid:acceptor oxidoreductase subunit alpha [Solirubrobacterales bacterium]|nr:2-oxoacid:acceptor oxidoreductase subunit alpha [Solirubrobacterales bacterium]